MKRKYGKFNPKQNRPAGLPLRDYDLGETVQDPLGMFQAHYKHIAWDAYWKMVRKTAKKHKLRLWAAHQKLQKDHPFQVPDMGDKDYCWHEDEFLMLFMWQFEEWENKTYDMDKRYDEGNQTMVRGVTNNSKNKIASMLPGLVPGIVLML